VFPQIRNATLTRFEPTEYQRLTKHFLALSEHLEHWGTLIGPRLAPQNCHASGSAAVGPAQTSPTRVMGSTEIAFQDADKSQLATAESRLLIALHSPMPALKPDCTCALRRKAGTVTAFAAEQCVLCSPVCPGTIAKYGQFSRISEVEEPAFSAVQTAWRRGRDSITAVPSKSW
jgi:hypothetical protein